MSEPPIHPFVLDLKIGLVSSIISTEKDRKQSFEKITRVVLSSRAAPVKSLINSLCFSLHKDPLRRKIRVRLQLLRQCFLHFRKRNKRFGIKSLIPLFSAIVEHEDFARL